MPNARVLELDKGRALKPHLGSRASGSTLTRRPRAHRRPRPLTIVVAAGGLVLTGIFTWAASTANQNDDNRLLQLQTRQVASTLGMALPSVQSKLEDGLAVATLSGSRSTFRAFAMNQPTGTAKFVSESLWERTSSGATMLTYSGSKPRLVQDGLATRFFQRLPPTSELRVSDILGGSSPRLGYAEQAPGSTRFIVYAESAIPSGRKLAVPKSSPFGALRYAIYLGKRPQPSNLIAASVATPVTGQKAVASVPFGNTTITVVATPSTELTGTLSSSLPWIVLGVGLLLTIATAATVEYIGRRRREAEQLAGYVNELYGEQRSIATTLQHALLPEALPEIPGMEIAARYVAGADGVEVGGDWYEVVPLGKGRFVFVVGDVSGRGLRAASVMASLRFASRGFALEEHPPSAIIDQLRKTLDFGTEVNFATVLCGLVHVPSREVVLANAGHLPPILCHNGSARIMDVHPVPPIGVRTSREAHSTVVTVPAGSTLLAYTDGLIERRREDIDSGIQRLEKSVVRNTSSIELLLDKVITDLTGEAPSDDVALLGMRWAK